MSFKDLFSGHSEDYKRYRPGYPPELFEYLAKQVTEPQAVWDCGTGNGQGAVMLAPHFSHVYATDASAKQIEQAHAQDNIQYSVATAENSGLPDQSVTLVTVFQALHWFNLEAFFAEVKRVLKPGGVLAVVGYNTAITGIDEVDAVYKEFCFDYLWKKNCWAMERGSLNEGYVYVDFPFEEFQAPEFNIEMQWNYQDYLSYLRTWSAVKKYHQLFNEDPVETFVEPRIQDHWPSRDEARVVRFPLVLRVGRV